MVGLRRHARSLADDNWERQTGSHTAVNKQLKNAHCSIVTEHR